MKEQAFDFHFSAGQPISLCGREGICFLVGRGCVSRCPQDAPAVTSQQIRELFLQICGYSVYAHEDELRQGYVRLGEGCRVGVCGSAVMEGGVVRGLRDVTSLVFRIPRRRWGCADRLFTGGIPVERGVLVAGPPSSGKTTFLRDIARSLSLGRFASGRRVAIVDERGELGGFANALARGHRLRRALPTGFQGGARGGGRGGGAGRLCSWRSKRAVAKAPVPGPFGERSLPDAGVPKGAQRAGRAGLDPKGGPLGPRREGRKRL